jgi:HD superfamily phosphohydrolase YqeK
MQLFNQTKESFLNYAKSFLSGNKIEDNGVNLKIEHTLRVLNEAENLAENEKFDQKSKCALLYAALLHDLSRFEQFVKYKTFRDSESFDHGVRSAELTAELNFVGHLEADIQQNIISAIEVHNNVALPSTLCGRTKLVAEAVRDADKIDIMYFFTDYLENPENPAVVFSLDHSEPVSKKVMQMVVAHKTPEYQDMKSVNDFLVSKLIWGYDLNFRHSRKIFVERNYLGIVKKYMPHNKELEKVYSEAVEFLAKNC